MPRPRKRQRLSWRTKDPGVIVTEYLRYAGLVDIAGLGHTAYIPQAVAAELGELDKGECYVTIEPPHGLKANVWVDQNQRRLASFGITAIAWLD